MMQRGAPCGFGGTTDPGNKVVAQFDFYPLADFRIWSGVSLTTMASFCASHKCDDRASMPNVIAKDAGFAFARGVAADQWPMSLVGHERLGGASCRSSNVRNAPLATVGPKKAACRDGCA
jgi:hypothetical protein